MRVRACSVSKRLRDSMTGFPWVACGPRQRMLEYWYACEYSHIASTVDGLGVRSSDVKFDGGEGNAVSTKNLNASIYEKGEDVCVGGGGGGG